MPFGLWEAKCCQRYIWQTQQHNLPPHIMTQFTCTQQPSFETFYWCFHLGDKMFKSLLNHGFWILPQHLRDGEHEGIMEYDAQGASQEVWTKLSCKGPEKEETGALLLLQLSEELGLIWQSTSQHRGRFQGFLLPGKGGQLNGANTDKIGFNINIEKGIKSFTAAEKEDHLVGQWSDSNTAFLTPDHNNCETRVSAPILTLFYTVILWRLLCVYFFIVKSLMWCWMGLSVSTVRPFRAQFVSILQV